MEEFGLGLGLGLGQFYSIGNAARKKRTQASRRPKPESQSIIGSLDHSPSSATPPLDDVHKVSSDEYVDASSTRKEFNLNQCMSRVSSAAEAEHGKYHIRNKDNEGLNSFYSNESGRSVFSSKRSSEGVLAPANWKKKSHVKKSVDLESINANYCSGRNGESQSLEQSGAIVDPLSDENKVKKVKLKVGGVMRTIHANSTTNGYLKNSEFLESSGPKHKPQVNSGKDDSIIERRIGLQGVPWKDFSAGGFSLGKEGTIMGEVSGKNALRKQGEKSEIVRKSKSKRAAKRCVLDEEIEDDYDDDEIRYLEKLKNPKIAAGYKDNEDSSRKERKLSSMSDVGSSKSVKDGKRKSSSGRASEETDYEEDLASEGEVEGNKKQRQKKESIDALMNGKREMTLTTRQRALQSSRDGSASGANLIEFPNGLPPAPSRKQKEKLTEVEQQLRKSEAAQKRRIQVEKAARESQAEAIKKILGQSSSRKKRDDKIKKRQEEKAQEKAANALILAPHTIRCVMGPAGTVVTFSKDMGLPSIFHNKACRYPPPREKCAGPSCANPYKYRDSKSKLPLCSLRCYRAVQGKNAS